MGMTVKIEQNDDDNEEGIRQEFGCWIGRDAFKAAIKRERNPNERRRMQQCLDDSEHWFTGTKNIPGSFKRNFGRVRAIGC
jgi:hypothetical protein